MSFSYSMLYFQFLFSKAVLMSAVVPTPSMQKKSSESQTRCETIMLPSSVLTAYSLAKYFLSPYITDNKQLTRRHILNTCTACVQFNSF